MEISWYGNVCRKKRFGLNDWYPFTDKMTPAPPKVIKSTIFYKDTVTNDKCFPFL